MALANADSGREFSVTVVHAPAAEKILKNADVTRILSSHNSSLLDAKPISNSSGHHGQV
jgi:hypothetical protein